MLLNRHPEQYPDPPPDWQRIIAGMVELRRMGHFYALYVDDWAIRIRRNMWDTEMERVFWPEARQMVDKELRKGVQNEQTNTNGIYTAPRETQAG